MKTKYSYMTLMVLAIAALSFISAPSAEVHGDTGSGIHWTGKKVTGSHTGTIDFSEMDMEYKEGILTSASFTVDMTSMKCTDLDEKTGAKLIGHLMNDDFFGVTDHPTSTFESTSIVSKGKGQYEITGDLTIKDVTQSITFPAEIVEADGMMNAAARIEIDRTKHGIKYGSGSFFDSLGDKAINDEFILDIHIRTDAE